MEQVWQLAGGVGYDVLIGTLGIKAPMPGVLEGGNLGGRLLAALFLEEDVVVGVGVEGRVEVDEVNAGVGDVIAQDFEVIAEVELILNQTVNYTEESKPFAAHVWGLGSV